jgi:hypothetical protein
MSIFLSWVYTWTSLAKRIVHLLSAYRVLLDMKATRRCKTQNVYAFSAASSADVVTALS